MQSSNPLNDHEEVCEELGELGFCSYCAEDFDRPRFWFSKKLGLIAVLCERCHLGFLIESNLERNDG